MKTAILLLVIVVSFIAPIVQAGVATSVAKEGAEYLSERLGRKAAREATETAAKKATGEAAETIVRKTTAKAARESAEQLARKAIELGKAGNIHALQLCLDRLTPPCKDRLVCFDLPSMRSLDDISVGIARIVTAVSEGNLTPQEGEVVFRILEGHAKIMNTQDLERRVEKLERGPSRNERKIEVVKSYC